MSDQEQEKPKSGGFEYRYEDMHGADWLNRLNALGAENWEVVSMEMKQSANVCALLKREVPPDRLDEDMAMRGKTDAERKGDTRDHRAWTAPSIRERRTIADPAQAVKEK